MSLLPISTQLLTTREALEAYRAKYDEICGTLITDEYLFNQRVYGVFEKGKMTAGFIIGQQYPYRTIDQFILPEDRPPVYDLIKGVNGVGEACAVWRDRESKGALVGMLIWMHVAWYAMKTNNRIFLMGTFEPGLARLYSYPKYGYLISQTPYRDGSYYIFMGFKENGLRAAMQLLKFKLMKSGLKLVGKRPKHKIPEPLTPEAVKALMEQHKAYA
jgi:hypothetical protein